MPKIENPSNQNSEVHSSVSEMTEKTLGDSVAKMESLFDFLSETVTCAKKPKKVERLIEEKLKLAAKSLLSLLTFRLAV